MQNAKRTSPVAQGNITKRKVDKFKEEIAKKRKTLPSKDRRILKGKEVKFDNRYGPVKKKLTTMSKADAAAAISSVPATRTPLEISQADALNFIRYIAVLVSYDIQSNGSMPSALVATENRTWCPSQIACYLWGLFGSFLNRIGALTVSSKYIVSSEYMIPPFFALWLQQHAPIFCKGREIIATSGLSMDTIMEQDFDGVGIPNVGAAKGAPAAMTANASTEPNYTYTGPGSPYVVNFQTMSADTKNYISTLIARTYPYACQLGQVPIRASTPELKCTPVQASFEGNFMFSCLDGDYMCDLILPLSSIYSPTLINSMTPAQVQAPVRVDGNLTVCPEAKIAFLFWLVNKRHNAKETKNGSFIKYIREFGFKDRNLGNIQVNLRQVDWTALINMVMTYVTTFCPAISYTGFWYLVNYIITVVVSNVPAAFRAFTPLNQGFSVSLMNPSQNSAPCYAAALKSPKIPQWLASIIKGLRMPIRSGNTVSFFYIGNAAEDQAATFWFGPYDNASGVYGGIGNYGIKPSQLVTSTLSWSLPNTIIPYPGFKYVSAGLTADNVNNYCCLNNITPVGVYLQAELNLANGSTNLFAQWGSKTSRLGTRMAKYYIPTKMLEQFQRIQSGNYYFEILTLQPEYLGSWEPCSQEATVLAFIYKITYYMPTTETVPILTSHYTVSPVAGVGAAASTAMVAAVPAQGSPQQVAIGKSNNPEEVEAQMQAAAAKDVVPDCSHPDAKQHIQKATEQIANEVQTCFDDVKQKGISAAKGLANDLIKGAGLLL